MLHLLANQDFLLVGGDCVQDRYDGDPSVCATRIQVITFAYAHTCKAGLCAFGTLK